VTAVPELRQVDVGYDGKLLLDAARMVIDRQHASRALIQRRVRVGFAKAGRLIDLLEEAGVIGPATADASGAREVLVPRAERDAALAQLGRLAIPAPDAPDWCVDCGRRACVCVEVYESAIQDVPTGGLL
jgi:hypothetical protein